MEHKSEKKNSGALHKTATAFGAIMCIILLPILIVNVTLIVRSFLDQDKVPSVGGAFPLIVLTDSMYPEIQSGDLIICKTQEPEEIKAGDVIAFFDPAGNGKSIVTHRVTAVTEQDGAPAWRTKGDANNAEDRATVPAEKLAGVYARRIPLLGNAVMFMQTTAGLIVCVVCPILLLVGWDVLRRRKYEKSKQADTEALLRELEELRAQKAKREEDKTSVS